MGGTFECIAAARARRTVKFMHAQPMLHVGLLVDKTGPLRESSRVIETCANIAVDEINGAGGVLGRPVELLSIDSGLPADLVYDQVVDLVSRLNVETFFGTWRSNIRKVVNKALEGSSALLWYPVQYEGFESCETTIYGGSTINQQLVSVVK